MSYLDTENGYLSIFNEVVASYDSISTSSLSLTTNAHTNDIITAINSNGDMAWTSTPTLSTLTLGSLSGVLKATVGLISGSATTSDLPEGSNLYYTDARSRAALSAGTGISYNSTTGVITNTGTSTITGTANQVLANGTSGTPQTGAVTLTLPQSIATTSPVRFGSVAVGTVSSYPLHIASGNGYMLCDLNSTYAAEYVGVNSGGAELRIYGDSGGNAHVGTVTNHDLAFRTNDVNKMWLTNAGYLGIGVYPTSGVYLDVFSTMYVRDANAGMRIITSLGTNYIQSASAGMSGAADLRFTDMNNSNTWMTIKSDGKLGLGTTSPATKMHIQTSGTTTQQMLTIENAVTSSAGQPTVLLKRSRGTIASPTTLSSGDTVGALTFQGYDGSNYISAASISALNDDTVGTNSMPTALIFRNTPLSGVATVENMRISSNGYVGIGTTPGYKLHTSQSLDFASRGANPLPAQIVASSSSGQLKLGNYYTAGVGTCGTIQASDFYSGVDHATPLLLNPLGGYVGIGTTSPLYPLHINSAASPQLVLEDGNAGLADMRHYVYGVLKTVFFSNSTSAQLRTIPNIPLYLGYNSDIQVTIGDTTNGYPTAMTISNQTTGPCLKLQESSGTGRGHIQFGSSSTAANNIHIGCEGNGSFYVWNGNWGTGTQKFQIGSTGNFRFDNNSGYMDSAIYGVGGSYFTLFNTNSGGHSSQIGHDGTTMYISTGAGGNMYLQTYAAGYSSLTGRIMLDQGGQLSFNSMTADATINILGTSAKPLAGIALGGYGYDATPYHRLELANGAGSYIYYMSQNIKWSSPNNRWEFVNTGGWGGYGSVFNFYGNGNAAFSTASNVAGLPSFKTNLALTNDGNCTVGYNLNVSGTIQATLSTPASSSAAGTSGQIKWDANYIYVCTATNTWKRVALSSF